MCIHTGVVFAGGGEPLLRVKTLIETVNIIAAKQNGIAFRINTNGLVDSETTQLLLDSGVIALGDRDFRRETRIASVSVALPCHDVPTFELLSKPEGGKGFRDVCNFICLLVEAGVQVECTAIDRPEVDLDATKKLALALGASNFRVRTFAP